MTTLWWVVVLALGCSFSFCGGYIVRVQFELYHRQAYDIDFTRRRVGEGS